MRRFHLSLIFALAGVAGCGQVESSPSSSDEATPPGVTTARPVDSPPPASSTRYPGSISLTSSPDSLALSAMFARRIEPSGKALTPGCRRIEKPLGPGAEEGEPRSESAGNISFEVAAKDKPVTRTLAFDPSRGGYDNGSIDGPVRDVRVDLPGGAIRIRASGGKASTSVPAFETTVTAALALKLEEPAAGATISATSGDIVVRWTDGGNQGLIGMLWLGSQEILCQFEPAAGKAVVPAALVREVLEAERSDTPTSGTDALNGALLSLYALNTTTVAAGDWDIAITRSVIVQHVLKVE